MRISPVMRAIVSEGIGTGFVGYRAAGIPGFIVAQLLGALAATLLFRWIGTGEGG